MWLGLAGGSPGQVAGLVAAQALPALLLGPLAGVLADRWDPRRALIACNLLRGGLVLSLVLVPSASLNPALYAVSFCVALVALVLNPSRNRLLLGVVLPDRLGEALGLLRSAESAALVLGPALGSALLLRFGPVTGLVFSAVSYAAGAAALATMRVPRAPSSEGAISPQVLAGELLDGLRFTAQAPTLLALLSVSGALALVGSLWFTYDLFFVAQSLGARPESVGLLWTASGVGGLVGGVATVVLSRRPRAALLGGLALRGGSLLLYALTSSLGWAGFWAFWAGFGEAIAIVAIQSAVLVRCPSALLGRVTALFDVGNQLASLLALGLAGLLAGFAPWQVLCGCGALLCLLTLGALVRKGGAVG